MDKKVAELLNEQVNKELYSAYLYLDMANFYSSKGLDGFAYAYQYPGMNKVLQAAGRVIRTDEDRGVILLLDERFQSNAYQRLFPREWEQHGYCRVDSVHGRLKDFWEAVLPENSP